MIAIRPRETVVLVDDFSMMVAWYRDVLGFEVEQIFENGFHYCNLALPSGIKLGIAPAAEMGIEPGERSKHTVIPQFEVDDVREFFTYLEENGATITGGPSLNTKDNFWFGSFADPEGNPIWVVDKNCP
ncbi:MAG: VOC family protein [Chloroflexi bacterium]|nr:VOC family protein [Chloroflexota bacterium]